MKTLTVKVPEELDVKLAAVAAKRGESKSVLVRAALESMLSKSEVVTSNSCLDLARDLAGSVEGPSDLSHSTKHLEGYGK